MQAFAYPFGFVDGLARNAAAAAGYAVAVTTRHGHARWGYDPLLLPRIMVTDADDPGTPRAGWDARSGRRAAALAPGGREV